jgi:hypothetical protein
MLNEIYFTKKGITQKLKIPNVWPSVETNQARREFFIDKGLVALIDPINVDKSYYRAKIQVFDAQRVEFFTSRDGDEYLYNFGFIWAELDRGNISISTRNTNDSLLVMDEIERNRFWAIRDEGFDLIRAAVDEFTKYFPAQNYKK